MYISRRCESAVNNGRVDDNVLPKVSVFHTARLVYLLIYLLLHLEQYILYTHRMYSGHSFLRPPLCNDIKGQT